jgi:hypothetical protein
LFAINILYLNHKKAFIWIVKRSTTNHFATAHIPVAEREYVAIVLRTTEEADSCRHVIFLPTSKRDTTVQSIIS